MERRVIKKIKMEVAISFRSNNESMVKLINLLVAMK